MIIYTLLPGISPFNGFKDSNSFSYFSRSAGLIVQSTADGGNDVINGVLLGGGGLTGFGSGTSPYTSKNINYTTSSTIISVFFLPFLGVACLSVY